MSPFSILRRSPRGRKWNEQQNSRDDVKSPIGMVRDDIERDDADDAETTANSKGRRGGFNKDLLHNLRNRLTGKRTTSQPQPQQEAAAVSEMSSSSLSPPSLSLSVSSLSHQRQHILAHPSLPDTLQQFAVDIAQMQLQLCQHVVAFDTDGCQCFRVMEGANQGFNVPIGVFGCQRRKPRPKLSLLS